MFNPPYDPGEANEVFAWHLGQYVGDASRFSLIAAAQTETNSRELLRFAEARFHSLIHQFEASFRDSWDAIGDDFREAARNSIPLKGRRG
jgi:hypothetical protein